MYLEYRHRRSCILPPKCFHTFSSVWSKATGGVGGAGADPQTSKTRIFFFCPWHYIGQFSTIFKNGASEITLKQIFYFYCGKKWFLFESSLTYMVIFFCFMKLSIGLTIFKIVFQVLVGNFHCAKAVMSPPIHVEGLVFASAT